MWNFIKNSKGEILNLLFKDPDKALYLRQIARELGKENRPSYIQGALEFLFTEGVLTDERIGNLRFFKLNKNYPLYEELKKIISKTIGIEAQLKKMIDSLAGVEYAFIFGSIAKNKEYSESDIDLMLIGRVNQDDLIVKINKLEDELSREINYHIYSKNEVIRKIKDKSHFLTSIFNEPKIILKGNLDEFTRIN